MKTKSAETLAEKAYSAIRADLIAGKFQPGEKLSFRGLRARYGMGASPIREALARLTSEHLVEFAAQRGFSVAAISLEELHDLCSLRIDLYNKALRAAIERGDEHWEAEILVATHHLTRSRPSTAFDEWDVRHARFHASLIAACGSPWLIRFCDILGDQFRRYRRLLVTQRGESDELWAQVLENHREISEAVLARDSEHAVDLMTRHFEGNLAQVIKFYGERPAPAKPSTIRSGRSIAAE